MNTNFFSRVQLDKQWVRRCRQEEVTLFDENPQPTKNHKKHHLQSQLNKLTKEPFHQEVSARQNKSSAKRRLAELEDQLKLERELRLTREEELKCL